MIVRRLGMVAVYTAAMLASGACMSLDEAQAPEVRVRAVDPDPVRTAEQRVYDRYLYLRGHYGCLPTIKGQYPGAVIYRVQAAKPEDQVVYSDDPDDVGRGLDYWFKHADDTGFTFLYEFCR